MLKRKLLIILDAGHGGSDPGACANGVIEKVANFNTVMQAKIKLEKAGAKVVLTRESDIFVSLQARTDYSNKISKQYPEYTVLFISIHHNAGGGDRAEGIYSITEGTGKEVAESITKELLAQLGQTQKCYSKRGTNNKDYYHVIRATVMPAVIIEVAFLDNNEDVKICDTVEEQKRNGEIIADGIVRWCGELPKQNIEIPEYTPPEEGYDAEVLELQKELNIQGFRDLNGQRLVEDGIAGPKTLSACPTIKKGAYGNITRLVQRRLIGLGISCGQEGADKDFGDKTDVAVREFQRNHGLVVDGIVGPKTWDKLKF